MARPHVSRYATLLRVRQRQEELKSFALAEVRREIRNLEAQRDEIITLQRETLAEAGRRMASHLHADEIQSYYQYERHLARQAVELDARVMELRKLEEQRRLELEEALKSRKMIEKLSEREREALRSTLHRNEQAVLDETATNQAAARLPHGSG